MIQIIHKFTCDLCGDSVEDRPITYISNDVLPIPHMPCYWRTVSNLLLCPKHQISQLLFIDGKEIKAEILPENRVVLMNLNGGVTVCSEEQAEEIEIKQALEVMDNAFDCTFGKEVPDEKKD